MTSDPGPARRPPQVLGAAAAGAVIGVLCLVGSLAFVAAGDRVAGLAVIGGVYLLLAVAALVGAVRVVLGRGSRVLRVAAVAVAALALIGVLLGLAQGTVSLGPLLFVALAAVVLVLLRTPAARSWTAGPH